MARRQNELERVVESLRAAGGDAELYAADVTSMLDLNIGHGGKRRLIG